MEPIPLARRLRARDHMDSRWAGGDACRIAVRRDRRKPELAALRRPDRVRCQCLSDRSGDRRLVLRLADGPAGSQEAVYHHGADLPFRHHRLRPVMGFLVFRGVPRHHRSRHRRRVRGRERDHPGADSGTSPRLYRSCHQRELLGRSGDRCGRRAGRPRSCRDGPGIGLAGGVRHRWRDRVRRPAAAPLYSRKVRAG